MNKYTLYVIVLIITAVLIPLDLHAQGPKFEFKPMTEKEIRKQIISLDIENIASLVMATAGICGTYVGIELFLSGLEMFSESFIDTEDLDSQGLFYLFPWLLLYYAVAFTVTVSGPIISFASFEISHMFFNNFKNNIKIRRNFSLVLKRFEPTSYKDRPGIGIGISFSLDNRGLMR